MHKEFTKEKDLHSSRTILLDNVGNLVGKAVKRATKIDRITPILLLYKEPFGNVKRFSSP